MARSDKKRLINIIGVALEGRNGYPLVIFADIAFGRYFPVETDPYEADLLIRDYTGEAEDSATAWLAGLLTRRSRRRAVLEEDEEGAVFVRVLLSDLWRREEHSLRLGEGLSLVRRLNIPLSADPDIFLDRDDELAYLSAANAFRRNFLYLTPPHLSPVFPNS